MNWPKVTSQGDLITDCYLGRSGWVATPQAHRKVYLGLRQALPARVTMPPASASKLLLGSTLGARSLGARDPVTEVPGLASSCSCRPSSSRSRPNSKRIKQTANVSFSGASETLRSCFPACPCPSVWLKETLKEILCRLGHFLQKLS